MAGPAETGEGALAGSRSALRRLAVLAHFPPIAVAVAASAVILALSSAGGLLFQSSAATAVVRSGIGDQGGLALSVKTNGALASDVISYQQGALERGTKGIPSLGAETTTLVGSTASIQTTPPAKHPVHVRLLFRTGFLSHVDVVSRSGSAAGVWVPDVASQVLHLSAGDRLTISEGPFSVTVPVAGIYRTLVGRVPAYWAPVASAIYPVSADATQPPPPLLTGRAEFLQLTTALQDTGDYQWDFDLTPQARSAMSLDGARTLLSALNRIASRSHDLTDPLGVALQQPSVASPLQGIVERAATAENSIAGPVGTLSVTGAIVALVGVLAAGVYGIRRRRTEVRMLNAIGISWLRLGARFAAEAVAPLAIGAVLGWILADGVVHLFGPSPAVDPRATATSALAAAAWCGVALLVFGVVAAAAARVETEAASGGKLRSVLSGALWELPVLILAGAALYEIDTRGTAPIEGANGSVHIDRLFLLFPILFIAGFGGLIVRVLSRALIRLHTRSAHWPVSLYLAARRLASAPRVALLLVTASCLAVGILAYAGTVVSTIRTATRDKTMVAVGADVAATHGANLVLPPQGRPQDVTRVISISGVVSPGGHAINVIAVDPSSFGGTAFWDPSFASPPLDELMRSISESSTAALPAIAVKDAARTGSTLAVAGYPIPLRVVATADAFPGEQRGLNLVVSAPVLRRTLAAHGQTIDAVGASYQTWARGDPAKAIAYFKSLGISPQLIESAAQRLNVPSLRALSWAFGFMEVLGAMTATVALIGLVLYLQARQRGREMTFALSRRMGLAPRSHLLALASELVCILVAALVIGGALALSAAGLVFHRLDPLPTLPPSALLQVPIRLLGAIVVGIVVSTLLGSALVQRQTERANIAQVMRFAD